MLQRWGDSENVFKEMMARFHLNYHPGYDIKELENQPLVDNPDIALIKKAIGILQKEVKALEEEILLIEAKQMRRRDVKQVLDMITGRAGYIKLVGQTLIVILDWIETKKHREAAERFCRILNKRRIRLAGRLNVKLSFYVSQFPQHDSKAASTSI